MPLGFSTEELTSLPTTSYRFVLVTRLIVGTGVITLVAFGHAVYAEHNAMALDILNAWLIFLGALAGINVAQYGIKRGTDTDMRERVAKAKAPTQTALAQPGGTVVQAAAPSTVTAEHGAVQVQTGQHAVSEPEHEWASGDPREGIL